MTWPGGHTGAAAAEFRPDWPPPAPEFHPDPPPEYRGGGGGGGPDWPQVSEELPPYFIAIFGAGDAGDDGADGRVAGGASRRRGRRLRRGRSVEPLEPPMPRGGCVYVCVDVYLSMYAHMSV